MTYFFLFTALAAQPAIEYGNHLINPSQIGVFRPLGWSADEQYYAWDTELNGGGALAKAQRNVIDAAFSGKKAVFVWDEADSEPQETWLQNVASTLFADLDISGNVHGHLIYQFAPSFFLSNHKLKPWNLLKTQYSFTLQGVNYKVVLNQDWEPAWTSVWQEGQPVRYKRAKVSVSVLRGSDSTPIGKVDFTETAGYAINKIYLSPSRDRIAVCLARFTLVWFEGINLMAEHKVFAGAYR